MKTLLFTLFTLLSIIQSGPLAPGVWGAACIACGGYCAPYLLGSAAAYTACILACWGWTGPAGSFACFS
jgi:hypothetical protein